MKNGWIPMDLTTVPRDREILLWMPEVWNRPVIGRYYKNALYGEVWDFEDGHSVALEGALAWQEIPKGPDED